MMDLDVVNVELNDELNDELTKMRNNLERAIYNTTSNNKTFGCFHVQIDSDLLIDYVTYNNRKIWSTYKIIASIDDFEDHYSLKCHAGHYNYIVTTKEICNVIKKVVNSDIGIYIGKFCERKAKRIDLKIDEDLLKFSYLKKLKIDLYDDNNVHYRKESTYILDYYHKLIEELEYEKQEFINKYFINKYGLHLDSYFSRES